MLCILSWDVTQQNAIKSYLSIKKMSGRLWTPIVRKGMHFGNDILVCRSTETSKCNGYILCFMLGWIRCRFWRRRLCILGFSWFCMFLSLNEFILLWLTPQLHFSTPFLIHFSLPFSPTSLEIKPPRTWGRPLLTSIDKVYMSGVLYPVLLKSSCSAKRRLVFRLYSKMRTCRSDAICKSFFFIIKLTRCTNFPNLFRHESLHVSDSSSAHHQEFIYCKLNNGICHTGS